MTESTTRFRWLEAGILTTVVAGLVIPLVIYGPFRDRLTPGSDGEPTKNGRRTEVEIALSPVYDDQLLRRDIRPTLRRLEDSLSIRVKTHRSASSTATITKLVNENVHIALLPALGCVQAQEREKALRLLVSERRAGQPTAPAIIAVRADSPHSRIEDLRGQPICFVDPSSMSGDLMVRLWLRSKSLPPQRLFSEIIYSGSHGHALRDLRRGLCQAAAVSSTALEINAARRDTERLRALATTGYAPAGCWLASPRLSTNLGDAIEQVLTNLDDGTHPPRVPAPLWITGFQLADNSTYRAVEVAARIGGRLQVDIDD